MYSKINIQIPTFCFLRLFSKLDRVCALVLYCIRFAAVFSLTPPALSITSDFAPGTERVSCNKRDSTSGFTSTEYSDSTQESIEIWLDSISKGVSCFTSAIWSYGGTRYPTQILSVDSESDETCNDWTYIIKILWYRNGNEIFHYKIHVIKRLRFCNTVIWFYLITKNVLVIISQQKLFLIISTSLWCSLSWLRTFL